MTLAGEELRNPAAWQVTFESCRIASPKKGLSVSARLLEAL